MLVPLAIILGLGINYFTGGLPFSSWLCIFAGIFMIMPSLLDFRFKDFLHLWQDKKFLWINLGLNFILAPLLARGIGSVFFAEIGLTISLMMLALLSGGGLVFARLKKSWADNSLGFQLFMINLLIFSGIFFLLSPQVETIGMLTGGLSCSFGDEVLGGALSCGIGGTISPISALVVLVLIPLILSRAVLLSSKLTQWAQKYSKILSQIGTFVIIAYIFSLQQVHALFSTEGILIAKIFGATLLFYLLLFGINWLLYRFVLDQSSKAKAMFWLSTSRFITLGLVLSFIYTQYFESSILLIFVSAYFIQIGAAQLMSRYLK